jgi:transcriptional regulator with XRE-family HTH domain
MRLLLKHWRARRMLTMQQLAERSGVAFTTIYRLEHGLSEARPTTIQKLAAALGIEPEELVVREAPAPE